MFKVTVDENVLARLREMLKEEGDDFCVRLREYKLGGGCRTRIIIGLGVDELDEDEDEKMDVAGVPFIAESDFLLRYGREFAVSFGEEGQIAVEALATQD